MEQSNTSLYSGLRQKLSANRENLKVSSERIVDLQTAFTASQEKISELQAQMQVLQNRVAELEGTNVNELMVSSLQTFSDENIQPILEELCGDIQSITEDVKILKSCSTPQIRALDSDLVETQSQVSVNKNQPKVKPITLNRSASVAKSRF